MRGLVLSHPAVAAVLAPYIVTWWEGRDDAVPALVRQVESGARFRRRGNMAALVLDADFRTVAGFVPYPGDTPFDRSYGEPAEHFATQIQRASVQLGLARGAAAGPVRLPTLPAAGRHPAGVRALIKITGDMNVHVPLVAVVPVPRAVWEALRYPAAAPREVRASAVAALFARLYPPAMMDQDNRVKEVRGSLTLQPDPGSPGRNALLSGDVEVVLAASTAFTGGRAEPWRTFEDKPIPGRIDLAITYPAGGDLPDGAQGLFSGTYSRPGRLGGKGPEAQIEAVLEAVP